MKSDIFKFENIKLILNNQFIKRSRAGKEDERAGSGRKLMGVEGKLMGREEIK